MPVLRGRRDGTAIEAFVDRELERLTRLAISLTGNRIDADDLVQETLAAVVAQWRKVDSSGAPRAYVRRIMINLFLSGQRRASTRELVSDRAVEQGVAPSDETEAYIARHDLLSVVATLPRRQRAVIVLRYLEDLPVADVASIMQMREGAVRTACHRALASLRDVVTDAERPDRPPPDRAARVTALHMDGTTMPSP